MLPAILKLFRLLLRYSSGSETADYETTLRARQRENLSSIAGNHVLARSGFDRRLPRASSRQSRMLSAQQDPQRLSHSHGALGPSFSNAQIFKPRTPLCIVSADSIL